MSASFLFYDLETFGISPRQSRIAQFAAIRTTPELDIIGAPISFFVKPANDLLPSPYATLVTGITPQAAQRDGLTEAEAFARIAEEMSRPQTCSLGYNSLRFDDEFIRYGLYRNFYDPYEREWRNGNSRWDLLDALRLMHALRPDGITWRQRDDGKGTSFRLEHLAEDNGLREGMAHEALSDVRALIGVAKRFKTAQPKLWDYALRLRDKRTAANLLDTVQMTPVLHLSQRYPASRMCAAPVLPLAVHPAYSTRVIVFDLDCDPTPLLQLDADGIAARLYVKQDDLPEGISRIPLKEVHTNKCPALVEWKHLRDADFQRLNIDPERILRHAQQIHAAGPALAEKIRRVFARESAFPSADVDAALYEGFFAESDKRLLRQIRSTPPHLLTQATYSFRDPRLPEMLFRYRARNWPEHLLPHEYADWNRYRQQRLLTDAGLSELTLAQYHAEIAELRHVHADAPQTLQLLEQLDNWGRQMAADLAQ